MLGALQVLYREFSCGGAYVDFRAEGPLFRCMVRSDDGVRNMITSTSSPLDYAVHLQCVSSSIGRSSGIVVFEGLIRGAKAAGLEELWSSECLLTDLPRWWMGMEEEA
ncbi:hypothetical protein Tco_1293792 [Tanacetum coccineum]